MSTGPTSFLHSPGVGEAVGVWVGVGFSFLSGSWTSPVTYLMIVVGVGSAVSSVSFPRRLLTFEIITVISTGTDKTAVTNSMYFFLSGKSLYQSVTFPSNGCFSFSSIYLLYT